MTMAFISRKRPNEAFEVDEDPVDENIAPLKIKRRQFPLEFKLQIVSQAKELSNRKVAKMHGLDESCIRSWRKNEEILRQTLETTSGSNPGLLVFKENDNSDEQFSNLTNTSPYEQNEIVIDPQDLIPDDNSDENDDKVKEMLEPFLKHLLDKNFSSYGKIGCVNAIGSLIDKELNVSEYLIKKEIIDEIGHIAETIYKRVGNLANMDFSNIARILAKVNETSEGVELIDEMKISFGASKRLFLEMEKFEAINASKEYIG